MSESSYFATTHAALEERARLDLLEAELDPTTIGHLRALGVGDHSRAWRCLEVAGGGGSIARWLAHAVGPTGTVTVTDVDTRFLDALDLDAHAPIEVRRHDLVADPLEPLAYDLVHCRLLLVHLPDAVAAVARLAGAVAPGGVLVLEEFEYATLQVADTTHELAPAVTRVNDALLAFALSAGIDVFLGRRLPDMLEAAGLTDVGHCGTLRVTRGTAAPSMAKASTALLAPRLTGGGLVTTDDLDAWFDALSDPSFRMIDYALLSAWGHRPPL